MDVTDGSCDNINFPVVYVIVSCMVVIGYLKLVNWLIMFGLDYLAFKQFVFVDIVFIELIVSFED